MTDCDRWTAGGPRPCAAPHRQPHWSYWADSQGWIGINFFCLLQKEAKLGRWLSITFWWTNKIWMAGSYTQQCLKSWHEFVQCEEEQYCPPNNVSSVILVAFNSHSALMKPLLQQHDLCFVFFYCFFFVALAFCQVTSTSLSIKKASWFCKGY